MARIFQLTAALALAPTLLCAEPMVERPDAPQLPLTRYLDTLTQADVIFLGERHDNERHHRWQAEATAHLERSAGPGVAALVFEMIPEEKEAKANAARGWPQNEEAGAAEAQSRALARAVDWVNSGWPDFALYAPILTAAPRAYVAGAGYERGGLRRASKQPGWLKREPQAARFGLDQPLPKAQQAEREANQIASHCNALPAHIAPKLVNAQRARDGRLARAILRARAKASAQGREGKVVVITGSGHARRDYGAPTLLALGAPELRVVAFAFAEEGGRSSEVLAQRFSAWARTKPPSLPRGDPCAAFKKPKK